MPARSLRRALLAAATLASAAAPALLAAQAPAPAAAPAPSHPITFGEAIAIALRQNTTLRQAQNAVESSETTVRQQRLAFLPSLSLSSSGAQTQGRNFSETTGSVMNQTTSTVNTGIASTVTLFNGGQNVAGLRGARLSAQASDQDLTRARQTTVFTVASQFLALVTGQEQLRVQRENLAAQQAQEQQIDRFVKAGSRAISDLYQQQATTASARSAVVAAERDLAVAKVNLMQTLQLDPRGSYDFVAPTVSDSAAARTRFDVDSLLSRAFAARTDLAAAGTRVSAAAQGVREAQGGRLPSVALTVGYSSAYNSAMPLTFFDQFNQQRGGSVGLGLSLPLFDRGVTSAATEQARLQEENARLALEAQRQTVGLEVRRAALDFDAARQQYAAAQAQQRAADLAVSTTQQRYQVGASTLVELTQARATQVQAASAVVTARYTMIFQRALMSYYTGDLIPARLALGS